jgi:hypothetical protein
MPRTSSWRANEHGYEPRLNLIALLNDYQGQGRCPGWRVSLPGDPNGVGATLWRAKEAVHELHVHLDTDLALDWVIGPGRDLKGTDYPAEAGSLGRALIRRKHLITAWHLAHGSNGLAEAVNNLIKRVKAAIFEITSF